jgi:DNA-binding CsgD family transcriptional regulator
VTAGQPGLLELMLLTLDRLSTGIVALSSDARVLAVNGAAERLLASQSELAITDGQLRATVPAVAERLAAALERLRSNGRDTPVAATSLRLAGPGGAAVEALVMPLGRAANAVSFLLVLHPCASRTCDPTTPPPARVLAQLYGLTPAECRAAERLTAGRTIAEAAADLGVRYETVRTHVKRVYQKVGVSRQSDLVRVLAGGVGRVFWD